MPLRERAHNRVRERLETLAGSGLDAEQARRAAIDALRPVVGFDRWCWPTTDPKSALSTSGIAEFDLWAEIPRIAALEEHGDITSKPRLAVGRLASVTLSSATGGDLARSRRWRECMEPYGVGDELMCVCRDRHGCWGSVELMRDSSDPAFSEDDAHLLHTLAPILGTLIRRGLLRGARAADPEPREPAPATLILDTDLQPASWTSSIAEWFAELRMLPPAVYELGARVRTPPGEGTGLPASVRMRTAQGRWVTMEGAPLEGVDRGSVAITIRASTADEIFDLLAKTYDLTRRERELAGLLLDGFATKQLADALCISSHTVQDHLKAVFAKAGVRSRRELVSNLAGRAA